MTIKFNQQLSTEHISYRSNNAETEKVFSVKPPKRLMKVCFVIVC